MEKQQKQTTRPRKITWTQALIIFSFYLMLIGQIVLIFGTFAGLFLTGKLF